MVSSAKVFAALETIQRAEIPIGEGQLGWDETSPFLMGPCYGGKDKPRDRSYKYDDRQREALMERINTNLDRRFSAKMPSSTDNVMSHLQ